jgi:hypothetical protein
MATKWQRTYVLAEGRPIERIVSIPYMAQAVMAIVLQRPDTARARPSSLLKKNEDYERLFSLSHPIISGRLNSSRNIAATFGFLRECLPRPRLLLLPPIHTTICPRQAPGEAPAAHQEHQEKLERLTAGQGGHLTLEKTDDAKELSTGGALKATATAV